MDTLIWLKKLLDVPASALGVRPIARRVYRSLLELRYGRDGLAWAWHNGRLWKLHLEVALRGEFAEYETIEWMRQVVRAGDCVIDVGANVGQMTLEAAHLTGPAGTVVAIEPAPGNLKLLRTHIDANGFSDRVEVIEAACGCKHGERVPLFICGMTVDSVGSGHTIVPSDSVAQNIVHVPVVSIDQLCRERGIVPGVIKIDVEGSETQVVQGALRTLTECRPQVRFGFHPFAFTDSAAETRTLRALFAGCGYVTPDPDSGGSYELREYEAVPAPIASQAKRSES